MPGSTATRRPRPAPPASHQRLAGAPPRAPIAPKHVAGAVTVALLWALCYPLITTAVRYAPPLHIGALRAALAGVLLVVLSLALRRPSPRGVDWVAVIAIGVSSTGLGFAGMFMAGGRISPGVATVIANSQPLFAAIIGYFALGERLEGWQSAGMLTAFSGIAVVAAPAVLWAPPGGSVSVAGVAFVLLGAVGVAVGNVIMKGFVTRLDVIAATGWQLLAGSVVLFLAASALADPSNTIRWTAPFVLSVLGLAIPGTAIAFALWFSLLGRAPLNSLNVFSFLTPVFALGIGAAFYNEHLTVFEIAGACLVIAGAWMATLRARATTAATQPE